MDAHSTQGEELRARLMAGESGAKEELYRCYAPGVRRYCRYLLQDGMDAEDATHNTFLAAIGRIESLRDGASLRSWMFRIARNECLMAARRRSRHFELDDEPEIPGSETPLALTISREFREAVRDAVQALGPLYREAIVLREFEGCSYREIADATGAPISAVKFRLFKARERLAERLREFLDERREP